MEVGSVGGGGEGPGGPQVKVKNTVRRSRSRFHVSFARFFLPARPVPPSPAGPGQVSGPLVIYSFCGRVGATVVIS